MNMWKDFRKTIISLFIGIITVTGVFSLGVSAEESESKVPFKVPGPESIISVPQMDVPEIQSFATGDEYLPALRSGRHVKWIDRVVLPGYAKNFYKLLEEGSDNDGDSDFLIDRGSGNVVERVNILETAANGSTIGRQAYGIKVTSIQGRGANESAAYNALNNQFLYAYHNIRAAFEAFDRDHPEVFWLSGSFYAAIPHCNKSSEYDASTGSYMYSYTGDIYFILNADLATGQFYITSDKYNRAETIRTKINEINVYADIILAETSGMTELQMITYFNDHLTKTNEYNYRIRDGEDVMSVVGDYPDAFECTAALEGLPGNYGPVCESYARAFKVLCDRVDIPCVLVDGFALTSPYGSGESHMWNYVKLDGAWYAVDVTWNDPIGGKAGVLSGIESEEYLLLGANNETNIGSASMRFIASHPERNQLFENGLCYTNGPQLSNNRYIQTMESLTVTATVDSVAYGYTEVPVLTAYAVKLPDQMGEPVYSWYEVDASGNETLIEGANTNVLMLSDEREPGVHTIRAKATLGRCTKSADVQITVIRTSFADVSEDEFYKEPVTWAVLNGITTGYKLDLFAPELDCTRGQVVTFLWRASGSPEPVNTENQFRDIKPGDYFYKAVLWAVENNITNGMYPNLFSPDETVTRGQVATFLYRAEGEPTYSVENPFIDVEYEFYYDAVLWAVENSITTGVNADQFAPYDGCTRGQVVTFLYRVNGEA